MTPAQSLAPPTGNARGFTLIECLVCMVVIGLLASIGVRQFDIAQARQRTQATHDALLQAIGTAKALARTYDQAVVIRPDTDCATQTWTCGWSLTLSDTKQSLQTQAPFSGVTVFSRYSDPSLEVTALGLVQPNQSLMFCSQRTDNHFFDFSLKLIIAVSGRVRSVIQPGESACK
jgi:prepilin-type N-terminal cleavage/methylation domain-containing protein